MATFTDQWQSQADKKSLAKNTLLLAVPETKANTLTSSNNCTNELAPQPFNFTSTLTQTSYQQLVQYFIRKRNQTNGNDTPTKIIKTYRLQKVIS